MIFLLLSIILNASLFIILKYFERFKVNNLQALVVNYFTAFTLGMLSNTGAHGIASIPQMNWAGTAIIMGSLFILVFILIAKTAQEIGISVATVANKMSVIIPVIIAVLCYHNSLGVKKIAGILLALLAVFLTSRKEKEAGVVKSVRTFFLPVVVFLGSGIIDALVNYAQEIMILPGDSSLFLASGFATAACIGFCIILFRFFFRGEKFEVKSLIAGILLGIPNYISIWCLMEALRTHFVESSVMYPLNNMGIVLLCAGGSFLLFREKFSALNLAGIGLSLIAITLIAFS
ncbi:MAG: EamA family transporter [Bacteroidia bacterium]